MGVGSKDSVPAGFPKKNSGPTPEGPSIRTGTGAGHRPLWDITMALKIKILRGARGLPLVLLFPLSLCEERGWPAGQTRKNGYGGSSAQKERDFTEKGIECAVTSFLRVEKGRKETPGALPPGPRRICRFSLHKNRRVRHLLNRRSYNKGARGPRESGGHHFIDL